MVGWIKIHQLSKSGLKMIIFLIVKKSESMWAEAKSIIFVAQLCEIGKDE